MNKISIILPTYNSDNVLEKAIKSKRLDKAFEQKIDSKIYESLRGVIIEK